MFSSPAYAQAAAGPAPGGILAFLMMNGPPLLLMFVIVYFLLIRPQQQRVTKHRLMIDAVKKGDSVVTGGGLIGKVTRVDEGEIEIEVAPNVRVRALKSTLAEVRLPGGVKPAND